MKQTEKAEINKQKPTHLWTPSPISQFFQLPPTQQIIFIWSERGDKFNEICLLLIMSKMQWSREKRERKREPYTRCQEDRYNLTIINKMPEPAGFYCSMLNLHIFLLQQPPSPLPLWHNKDSSHIPWHIVYSFTICGKGLLFFYFLAIFFVFSKSTAYEYAHALE